MDISTLELADRTLGAVLERRMLTSPDQIALKDAHTEVTYRVARRRALSFARMVGAYGIGWQEPVALLLDNHVDNALCWLGLALTGRLEVAINVAYRGDMLAHILRDSGARLLIVEQHYLPRVLDVVSDIPALEHIVIRHAGTSDSRQEGLTTPVNLVAEKTLETSWDEEPVTPAAMAPWDLISISYTSGTTGRSKGVLCPHGHAFGHAAADGVGRTAKDEVRFVVLPQFHIAGRWGGVYNAFLNGACAFIADRFHASTFWRDAQAAGARSSQLVGTMAEFIMLQPPRPDDRSHGLREIGIMPLPHDPQRWAERFGVAITTCYGSTEVGAVLETVSVTGNSVGKLRPGYEVRLVDKHDCEVKTDRPGELAIRPLLPWTSSIGYLNRPDQTAEVWRNGWLHSGDAFTRDEAGNYIFVDRVDDALRRRGENISSSEVEYLITKNECVQEVAVVGVPSDVLEDDLLAVIVRRPAAEVTEIQLAAQLAETLPYFMVPRYIRFVDQLPKTATEKVQKKALKALGAKDAWDAQAAGFTPQR